MKFKTGAYKKIQFGFGAGGVGAEAYKKTVGHYHTGVDYFNGYGSPIYSDNYGIVYKVSKSEDSPSNWQAVYYLVPDKGDWVEVSQGHLSKILVKEGDFVYEGQQIGEEGNRGDVWYNGIKITKPMQLAGDKRGSHCHEQFRPVKEVKKKSSGKHYLQKNGTAYKDRNGYYYEIKNDNETNGCVNPYTYFDDSSPIPGLGRKLLNLIKVLVG